MSEHAVDVTSRIVARELPLFELLNGFIVEAQLGLASVAETM